MWVADGNGGGVGTDWNATDMATMWAALANQDTTPHWEMLSGWQVSYELTGQHLHDVTRYKESLSGAWPPEKSKAAAAYVERLDELIAHLQATYDAAVANHSAFSGATMALADTRTKLKAAYDEYTANQVKIDQYRQTMASSGGLAGQAAQRNSKPPVTDERQQQLTWQARSLMFGLSSEVAQAQKAITQPAIYDAFQKVDDSSSQHQGGYVPPVLPPLFHGESGSGSSHTSTGNGSSHTTTPSTNGIGSGAGSAGSVHQHGLVLGGAAPTSVTGTPNVNPGIAYQSPLAEPPGRFINPPLGLPGPPQGGVQTSTSNMTPGGMSGRAPTNPGKGSAPAGGVRSMPPGGVIGGMPGGGLGQPGGVARAAQRISPVGGLINPANGGSRPGGSGTPGNSGGRPGVPMSGIGGRSPDHRGDDDGAPRWDPDNPWQTDEGVAPIVLPPREQRVDPGPAIGLDR